MAIEALEKRYPSLAFLLRMDSEKAPLFFQKGQNNASKKSIASLDLESVEVVYVYGLGEGEQYVLLKEWLSENRNRDLVFLEEQLDSLRHFLKGPHAKDILSHPQVHIRLNLHWKRLSDFAEECANAFPVERIEVVALSTYKRMDPSRFYRLRLMLHRKTTVSHALFHENQHYHQFIDHFLSNFYRMERSFDGNGLKGKFKGIPAIVCGAGPSLTKDIETLRKLQEKALIFAGGSAIPALTVQGIVPHFAVAYDPNLEEFERFQNANGFELPILYPSRLHPDIFRTCNGPSGYLHSQTGGWAEYWMETHLNLNQSPLQTGFTLEALSVTTAALQLACTYGCDPIILLGVDLAFTDNQLYASGVVSNPKAAIRDKGEKTHVSEKRLIRNDLNGRPVVTLVKWVMEQSAICAFIQKNSDITFLNATSGGLGLKKTPHTPLETISFTRVYDLYGKVHQAIQMHPLKVPLGKVSQSLTLLKESLKKGDSFVSSALQELEKGRGKDPETGKLILAQMELESLDAYAAFLRPFETSFPFLAQRKYRHAHWEESPPSLKWEIAHFKWSSYRDLIQFYREKIEAFLIDSKCPQFSLIAGQSPFS